MIRHFRDLCVPGVLAFSGGLIMIMTDIVVDHHASAEPEHRRHPRGSHAQRGRPETCEERQ